MANGIQKYIANKTCCIATNVKKTDDKIKYGSEDMICCINKDFMANVFSELLMCNSIPTDRQWYKTVLEVQWVEKSPAAYTFGTDLTYLETTQICDGYSGTKCALINPSGVYNWSTIEEANEAIGNVFMCQYLTLPSGFFVEHSFDSLTGINTFTYYYDETWGTDTQQPSLGNTPLLPFDSIVTIYSTEKTIIPFEVGCLTNTQLCSIKNWLDKYCQSC